MSDLKLVIVDLDGTLVDTRRVNYNAYAEAMKAEGFHLDFDYFCQYCNGRYYLDFLPQISTSDSDTLDRIHRHKKQAYQQYLHEARLNAHLVTILRVLKPHVKLALVTTASNVNSAQLLNHFQLSSLFDLILTREDVEHSKPHPEGFEKAMDYFGATAENTLIFEDSDVGLKAATAVTPFIFATKGFN